MGRVLPCRENVQLACRALKDHRLHTDTQRQMKSTVRRRMYFRSAVIQSPPCYFPKGDFLQTRKKKPRVTPDFFSCSLFFSYYFSFLFVQFWSCSLFSAGLYSAEVFGIGHEERVKGQVDLYVRPVALSTDVGPHPTT